MADTLQPHFARQALATHVGGHDTFVTANHKNWLVNGAGLGIYVHGRIHQQVESSIWVSDLIHKRGHLKTDDLLLMEEQSLFSMGEPLCTNSRLGNLVALAVLPTMSSANGEGDLIAYYQFGVVSYNTFDGPRETRYDGEGKLIQKGWDSRRMVNHLLNYVSAVGRYAVATLTRDHFFRSIRGLHFLKIVIGDGTMRSENVNRISSDVDPVLEQDDPTLLHGSATGYWIAGDRMFCTAGLHHDPACSSSPHGRGFVVWNQANTFTEDQTPLAIWEGAWTLDFGMTGVHAFAEGPNCYGFIGSDKSNNVYYASIVKNSTEDTRNNITIPIEWSLETCRSAGDGIAAKMAIRGCLIELVCITTTHARVFIKTDATGAWVLWKNLTIPSKARASGQRFLFTETLGEPPAAAREATWVQVRVEGVGATEIRLIELDFSGSTGKSGRQQSYVIDNEPDDFFQTNRESTKTRWHLD